MKFILTTFLLLSLTSFGFAQQKQCRITVNILGLHSNNGMVFLSLYNSAEGYPTEPGKAYRLTYSAITNKQCRFVLDSLPPGKYALACFHDENGNGKIDTNFLGIPTEGTCASNNAQGSFGPPKFKDAEFDLRGDVTQNISISY